MHYSKLPYLSNRPVGDMIRRVVQECYIGPSYHDDVKQWLMMHAASYDGIADAIARTPRTAKHANWMNLYTAARSKASAIRKLIDEVEFTFSLQRWNDAEQALSNYTTVINSPDDTLLPSNPNDTDHTPQ